MKKYIIALTVLALHTAAWALELPEQIGDNMVLQQQTQAKLWGWAQPQSTVSVTTSWNGVTYETITASNGRWELKVQTSEASYTNHTITIKGDNEERVLNNVLLGEVWFCSGQSNMEMPLRGFWNCPVEGASEAVSTSGHYNKSIRMCTIPTTRKLTPADKVKGDWKQCNPKNANNFSALAFFFARSLTDMLDVPVGIINCSWGGSTVEGWLPKDTLLTYPDGLTPVSKADYHERMVMFNGMLNPLAGYTIKGFLWNQGESNVGFEQQYLDRFKTMVRLWRKMWNQANDPLPIYTVELPGYWYDKIEGEDGARFRNVQHQIANELENCGCVSTTDLTYDFEPKQIHGRKKLEIGERMARMVAARDYGFEGFDAEMPELRKIKIKGNVIRLYFTHAGDGFDRMTNVEGFEVCCADGKWTKVEARAGHDWHDREDLDCYIRLNVTMDPNTVKKIRYRHHNFNFDYAVKNMWGLPVVPFCIDCPFPALPKQGGK